MKYEISGPQMKLFLQLVKNVPLNLPYEKVAQIIKEIEAAPVIPEEVKEEVKE